MHLSVSLFENAWVKNIDLNIIFGFAWGSCPVILWCFCFIKDKIFKEVRFVSLILSFSSDLPVYIVITIAIPCYILFILQRILQQMAVNILFWNNYIPYNFSIHFWHVVLLNIYFAGQSSFSEGDEEGAFLACYDTTISSRS